MRAVTTATAAAVLGFERKSFENLLSRLSNALLAKGTQGLERRIPVSVLPQLLLMSELSERLGLASRPAFEIAGELLRGARPAGPLVRMQVDAAAIREEIERRMEAVVETVIRPRRGRPARPRLNQTGRQLAPSSTD